MANPTSWPCGAVVKVVGEDPGMVAHWFWANGEEVARHRLLPADLGKWGRRPRVARGCTAPGGGEPRQQRWGARGRAVGGDGEGKHDSFLVMLGSWDDNVHDAACLQGDGDRGGWRLVGDASGWVKWPTTTVGYRGCGSLARGWDKWGWGPDFLFQGFSKYSITFPNIFKLENTKHLLSEVQTFPMLA
jgi:hypothetical protein